VTGGPAAAARRLGYLYISENNPNDDTDDVLQLTVAASGGIDLFFGHAQILADAAGNQNWSNQPEYDDILGVQNQAGASSLLRSHIFSGPETSIAARFSSATRRNTAAPSRRQMSHPMMP